MRVLTDRMDFGRDRVDRRLGRRRHAPRAGADQRRRASARAHGLQGHRAALGARDRRRDRGGRRPSQRLYLARAHRLLRQGAEGGYRRSPSISSPTSCSTRPSMRASWSASAPSSCRRSARPTTRPTTSSSICSRSAPFPTSRWAGPCWAAPRSSARIDRDTVAGYLQRNYAAPGMLLVAAGNVEHGELVRSGAARLRAAAAESAAKTRAGALCRRRSARKSASSSRCTSCWASPASPSPIRDYYAASVVSTALGGGMSSRLFQEIREKRGLVYSIYSFTHAYSDGGVVRRLCRHRRGRGGGADAGAVPRDPPARRRAGAGRARARARRSSRPGS